MSISGCSCFPLSVPTFRFITRSRGSQRLFVSFTDAPYTIQCENYAVNYLLNNYITVYDSHESRKVITTFVYLYCLQVCANAFIAAESGTFPDLNTQTEVFSKTACFFEHSTQKPAQSKNIFLESGFFETATLLTLV